MVNQQIKYTVILVFLITNLLMSATYYVDALNGNDSNSGLSESLAWRTISKVNSMKFVAGDRILFNRGQKWNQNLLIQNSGSAGRRINYGSFGTGNKPIITTRGPLSGWRTSTNWTSTGTNIWRISVSANYMRMFFNGTEYKQAKSSTEVNSTDRFYRTSSTIYVYATSNPASYYTSIEVPYTNPASPEFTCRIYNANYITIEDIEFQGGYRSVSAENADSLIIQNCTIGAYTNGAGFIASVGSNYGIFRNNTVDYKVTFPQYYMNSQSAGVELANGASYWKVHHNYIKDWILGGYFVIGWTDQCINNEFYNNEVSAPNQSYGRAFSIYDNVGVNPAYIATGNKVYNNYFHHYTVKSQLASNNCEISYNIFANVSDNFNLYPADHAFNNAGTCLYMYSAASYNKIYNNTFYNATRSAIYIDGGADNNHFANNLLIQSGQKDGIYGGFGYVSTSINNITAKNNMMWYTGKDGSDFMVQTPRNIGNVPPDAYYYMRTVNGFNKESGQSGHIISGNFQFYGPLNDIFKDAANDDFSLQSGSPAIEMGINESWMRTTDFNGNPINGKRDLGAIEFSGSTQNSAPVITSAPVTTGSMGVAYSYDVNASGTPAPVYKLLSSPTGMTINSSTGLIQWTPSSSGSFAVQVEANNGISPSSAQSFTISVASDDAPVINSVPVTSALANQLYSYDVNASGNPAPTYKLTVSPSGMSINSTSGLIQWTPTAAGSFNVTIEANNGTNSALQSFTIQVSDQEALSSSLISFWKLDETTGSSFIDQTGKNNAVSGSVKSLPVTGKVNGAQIFDGANTEINVNANSSFDFGATGSFAVEFWIKRPATLPLAFNEVAVGRNNELNGFRWYVGLNTNGTACFYMLSGGSLKQINGTTALTDGNWHHVVAVRDGSINEMQLYVDGSLQNKVTKSFTSGFSSSTAKLNIGWWSTNKGYTLEGTLDEIALYKDVLPVEDILDHYNKSQKGIAYFENIIQSYVNVNLKLFLQGPYSSGLMSNGLSTLLPLAQPYNSAPWNYSGSEKVSSIPADVVDWILVELRSNTSSSTVLKRRAGFIKKDGSIVDLDGNSDLKFTDINSGNYYVVIKHRNHLDVMSSSAISLSTTSSLFDFSTAASKAYGTNSLVNLGDGKYGMISGDGDANGLINILDYAVIYQNLNQTGYFLGDLDMNKIVDNNDFQKSGLGLFNSTKVPQ